MRNVFNHEQSRPLTSGIKTAALALCIAGMPFASAHAVDTYSSKAGVEFRITEVASGLSNPWSLAFLPGGDMLVTDGATVFRLENNDFNVDSFRSNVVLRWEWRAGSALYLVWQQDRSSEEAIRSRVSLGDMFASVTRPGDNFFAVKASFWFSPN